MAKYVVANGLLAIDTMTDIQNLCVNNVTIDISVDTVNYSCMGDGSWQSSAAGTKSWEVTFETALDDTEGVDLAATIGMAGILSFHAVGTASASAGLPKYTGNIIITGISINTPVDDYATVSWTAMGTGALSETFVADPT